MASEDGRERPGLIRDLFRESHRFDFFQAVRLLEFIERESHANDPDQRRRPVGHDDPLREVVTFKVPPSLSFPTSDIQKIQAPKDHGQGESIPEMVVTFLGLVGPSGVLPRHYTELLIQRVREKDFALRDFLDLFHHRLTSLFYRTWEKYRLPIGYERSQLDDPGGEPDPVTRGLYSLVGMATAGLRGRLEVNDEIFLHYGGHFAHQPRSAIALESLLEDDLDVPVRVLQAHGQWLEIAPEDQARMPDHRNPLGSNNRLGVDLIVGERVWEAQSKFRLRLGPLDWPQFRTLMPNGSALVPMAELTRMYVGPGFDFDVQVVLNSNQIPACQLDPREEHGPFLGWAAWLPDEGRIEAAEDAVFDLGGA